MKGGYGGFLVLSGFERDLLVNEFLNFFFLIANFSNSVLFMVPRFFQVCLLHRKNFYSSIFVCCFFQKIRLIVVLRRMLGRVLSVINVQFISILIMHAKQKPFESCIFSVRINVHLNQFYQFNRHQSTQKLLDKIFIGPNTNMTSNNGSCIRWLCSHTHAVIFAFANILPKQISFLEHKKKKNLSL